MKRQGRVKRYCEVTIVIQADAKRCATMPEAARGWGARSDGYVGIACRLFLQR